MTTHVFIVDENTFPLHLQYKFAGTGAGNAEEHIGLLSDIKRTRPGDRAIFYLLGVGFYGIFKVAAGGAVIKDPDYLLDGLKKKLIYRVFIEYDEVYPKYVTEWEALERLPKYSQDIIWSLIYRKLKGERGCTPIMIDEAERLFDMIRSENENETLSLSVGDVLIWESNSKHIAISGDKTAAYVSDTTVPAINIAGEMQRRSTEQKTFRAICSEIKKDFGFPKNTKYEPFLQTYFTENIGIDSQLDAIAGSKDQIIWIGNEVACGVGMQKIDVFAITSDTRENIEYRIIELKVEPVTPVITTQLRRYVNWANSYIRSAINSNIKPIIVGPSFNKDGENSTYWAEVRNAFEKFNELNIAREVEYFEFDIGETGISFTKTGY